VIEVVSTVWVQYNWLLVSISNNESFDLLLRTGNATMEITCEFVARTLGFVNVHFCIEMATGSQIKCCLFVENIL
jgi:hypothetical protein